jgi:hypothetical protein
MTRTAWALRSASGSVGRLRNEAFLEVTFLRPGAGFVDSDVRLAVAIFL